MTPLGEGGFSVVFEGLAMIDGKPTKVAVKNFALQKKEEMKLEKVLPMKFDSFYVSLLSEKYKSGKMNFVKAFFTGLQSNWKANKDFEFSSHIYILKNK